MERFQALIFALACMLILPWFIYTMVLLWEYRDWLALLTIISVGILWYWCLKFLHALVSTKIRIMIARAEKEELNSGVINAGDVVAVVEDGLLRVISSEHEQAKAFASTRFNIKEEVQAPPKVPDETVRQLYNSGEHWRSIAQRTGRTLPEIQAIVQERI